MQVHLPASRWVHRMSALAGLVRGLKELGSSRSGSDSTDLAVERNLLASQYPVIRLRHALWAQVTARYQGDAPPVAVPKPKSCMAERVGMRVTRLSRPRDALSPMGVGGLVGTNKGQIHERARLRRSSFGIPSRG